MAGFSGWRVPVARASTGIAFAAALAVATGLSLVSAGHAAAQERLVSLGQDVQEVTIAPNETMTIRADKEFGDLVVGSANIIDVVPLTGESMFIRAKKIGATNISVYDDQKKLIGVIDVHVTRDLAEVRSALRAAVPGAHVQVIDSNNQIRLTGTVRSAEDLTRVMEIAQSYSPAQPVLNQLRVSDPQQVMLEVRMIEAKRSAGRDLGIGWSGQSNSGTIVRIGTGPYSVGQNGIPFGNLVAQALSISGTNIDVVINALEKKDVVRMLAQPNLMAMSGTTASFHAGGEVPIQSVVQANGTVATSTTYRPFGVRLTFTPTVLDDGLINLKIEPEVSDIDRSIDVNGNPGFTSRAAETTVQLRNGQSFALAGLLQATNSRNIDQLPWLGSVPVLGALFRSTSFQKKESDLVIIVTPHLVQPATPTQAMHTPLDTTRSTNDVELFGLGLLEVNKDMLRSYRTGEGITGPYGHRLDLNTGGALAVAKK